MSLVKIAKKNPKVVGITAAMPSGTGLDQLSKACPDRFFDVGIAEEHAVLMAAGMAAKGMHPVSQSTQPFCKGLTIKSFMMFVYKTCLLPFVWIGQVSPQ